jgi:hypothetical protein
MGFDKNDAGPIVEPAKRTTKVNISMVVAVVVFFALGAAAILWLRSVHGH